MATDVSDFYARVNFHRLENLIDKAAPGHGAAKYIKQQIKSIRARQSFGLPVGGPAARLLAELALVDVDKALAAEGVHFTRFVDDFRIFLHDGQNEYDVLGLLAEVLGITEGLSLNAAKTKVVSRTQYLRVLEEATKDIHADAEGEAIDILTGNIYFDDEPNPEDIEALAGINLLGLLQQEIEGDELDAGRIKVVFRALKIVAPEGAVQYIRNNLAELTVFSRDVVLLMEALDTKYPGSFSDMGSTIVDLVLSAQASAIEVVRAWLLHLFVRGVVGVDTCQMSRMKHLNSVSDRRAMHLIRGRLADELVFRKGKTNFTSLSPMEVPNFLVGASCLPRDEYKNINPTASVFGIKKLDSLFLDWAYRNRESLIDKYSAGGQA